MMQPILFIASLLLLSSRLSLAKIVDGPDTYNHKIAEALCRESSTARISNQLTVRQMHFFFHSLQPESELYNCKKHYKRPLEALQVALDTGKGNVCTKEKVAALEKFHWDYIVPALSPKWIRASVEPIAPEPLRLFFMHYANQVTEKCKTLLPRRLKVATEKNHVKVGTVHETQFDKSIYGMLTQLLPARKITNYDSFTLLWSHLMGKERRKGHYYELYTDPRSGEQVMGLMKVQDASKAWKVQTECRSQLRPIYLNTVLPVMRLIQMGYGTVTAESEQLVSNSKELKNWYAIAQVCEALIPITFYEDPDMRASTTKLLKSAAEAKGLKRQATVPKGASIWSHKEGFQISMDELVKSADDSSIVEQVKGNIDKRDRSLKSVIKNVFNVMKTQLTTKLKNFFMTKSNKEESGDEFMRRTEADIKSEIEAFDRDEVAQHEHGKYVKTDDVSALARIQSRKLSTTAKVVLVMLMLMVVCACGGCAPLVLG